MQTIGFIGLGVMGEPMCRHLLQKGKDATVLIADLDPAPLQRLADCGAQALPNVRAVFDAADMVFMSLPSGKQVEQVVKDSGWLDAEAADRAACTLVDLGTTPVDLTRELAQQLSANGIDYMDAPVARTRQAAEQGTLAIMAGGSESVYERVAPWLRLFASDVMHCGGHGSGQVVKILNNMVLFQTVMGLSEALAVGEAAGVSGQTLFNALANGSADSFALRNHGMKALLPDTFPLQAFSTQYANKDLDYALQLAEAGGYRLQGAETVQRLFATATEQGFGDHYWPVIGRVVERKS
jgi:3-hydroxyisobutyrate dehydrogenase-like beta-hydroxyacid dehydrogenase